MILHITRNPDTLPDLEIRDENDNLVAAIYNQVEGAPDQTAELAEYMVYFWNQSQSSPTTAGITGTEKNRA